MTKINTFRISIIAAAFVAVMLLASAGVYATSVNNASGQVDATAGAYVRSSASILSGKVTCLSDNTKLTILDVVFTSPTSTDLTDRWYHVSVNGKTGYIRGDLVDTISYSPVAAKTTDDLNYRAGAGILMSRKGTFNDGTSVNVCLKATAVSAYNGGNDTWYMVKVGSDYCYVISTYVNIIDSTPAAPAAPTVSEKQETPEVTPAQDEKTPSEGAKAEETTATEQKTKTITKTTIVAGSDNDLKATGQVDATAGAYVRSSSTILSSKVALLSHNTNLTINGVVFTSPNNTDPTYRWYQVTVGGKNGYIRGDLVKNINYSSIEGKTTDDLNYRAGAGILYSRKGTFDNGTNVQVCLKATPVAAYNGGDSKWYMVKVGSSYYYSVSTYIKLADKVITTTEVVPVEEEPAAKSTDKDNQEDVKPEEETTTEDNVTEETAVTDDESVKDEEVVEEKPVVKEPVVLTADAMKSTGNVDAEVGAYIRSSSSTSSSRVALLDDNTSLNIEGVVFVSTSDPNSENMWFKVNGRGFSGYIRGDLVKNISCNSVKAAAKNDCTLRSGAGTSMPSKATAAAGTEVNVCMKATPSGSSDEWYLVKNDSGYFFSEAGNFEFTDATVSSVSISGASSEGIVQPNRFSRMSDAEFESYLESQGFTGTYITKLMDLHRAHPNWEFRAKQTGLNWNAAVSAQAWASEIQRAGSAAWVDANSTEIAYYLDPRNFLTNDRVFMFEDLKYHPEYQTVSVVDKIIGGTALETYGFQSSWFVNYGAQYDISPVHIASRAKQETGGGSCAINGHGEINGTVVYNPFNIGAYSTVTQGLQYAYNHGWTTKERSIQAGAQFLAEDYINAGQSTIYSEKFNYVNGIASHQYMTNIKAPYGEAYSTYCSYSNNGILNEAFIFVIPVYNNMPAYTSL